jgi:asparagine synthase (glutamine-hydrolysing)
MCGIAGQFFLDGLQAVDPALIQRMTDAIAHRGPDGEGQYVRGPIGLGHRRLSIIDLHTGSQPMCNEDGTVWIVFNGEIYNYQELRADLLGRGHTFKSASDTEVIVHLYEEFGEGCVSRLRGMFAFAIWDERNKKLFLARDRIGIKPLYYTTIGNALLFASEIKSLLMNPAVPRRFSPQGIDRFLTYYYMPGTETLFEGIFKLEPGYHLTVSSGQIVKRQYWDLHFEPAPKWKSFDDAVGALQLMLRQSVNAHMIADVPVGVLLSGGVDSTGVLRYAAEHSGRPIHTFTVGFEGQDFADERPFARLAAKRFGTLHEEISITADDFADFLPRYVWHMEEPICEPPAVALYHVAQLARDSSVKVLLSGEGGDEAFAGYNKYAYLLALEAAKSAFGPAKDLLRMGLQASAHFGSRSLPQYAKLVAPPLSKYYLSCTSSPFTPFNLAKSALYAEEFASLLDQRQSDQPTREIFEALNGQPVLNQMLHVDTKTWLPDDLLVKADKMTMAASVELRVPLLDHMVLEFAASLPASYKLRRWPPKRILRAALKDSVPTQILKRKKIGFPVPYDLWMRTQLRDFVHDTVMNRNGVLSSYFRRDTLSNLVDAHQRGEGGAQEVFSLLTLELMHQQFATGHSGR